MEEEKPKKKTSYFPRIIREFEDEGHGDPFDKASLSKEKPLDKLTCGKLEEVEKLKAWEIWLAERKSLINKRVVPNQKDRLTVNKEKLEAMEAKMKEKRIKLPETGKAPVKKTSAGDARFGNPHDSGNSDDVYGSSVDDKQIYIGKPAKNDRKDRDEPE